MSVIEPPADPNAVHPFSELAVGVDSGGPLGHESCLRRIPAVWVQASPGRSDGSILSRAQRSPKLARASLRCTPTEHSQEVVVKRQLHVDFYYADI